MTKEELSKLTKIKAEIVQIKEEIEGVQPEFSKDSVTGSSVNFPFTKHSIVIEGYDYISYESKINRIQNRLSRKLTELAEEKDRLTEYIYSIEDSVLRQILVYKYVDGMTWNEIGDKMHYSFETVRKKHDKFIKNTN